MKNIINSLGWIETSKDENLFELRSILRGQLLQEAVRIGDETVVEKALEFFSQLKKHKWYLSKQREFATESLAAIYDAGVMYGNDGIIVISSILM